MNRFLHRKALRLGFYLRGAFREALPIALFQRELERLYETLEISSLDHSILNRVHYCNTVDEPFEVGEDALRLSDISLNVGSYYYFDLKEYMLPFPPQLRVYQRMGDNITAPERPTIVKSRPIGMGGRNGVMLKLDKLRHYRLFSLRDDAPFKAKRERAVWRGILNNPMRAALVNRYAADGNHDIGYVEQPRMESRFGPTEKLGVKEQLENKYVISVEGYDVATNLKWIMASNSLCLMPRPKYETWFMEGTLRAGVHYAEVRPDFEDLDEKIAHFEANPGEAEHIIRNAKQHSRQFENEDQERLISLLVLQKYFELSGQIERRWF